MRRLAVLPLLILAGCAGGPPPPASTEPAPEHTPTVATSTAPPSPSPSPDPSQTPIQALVEHPLAEPLGLTQPSLSLELDGEIFIGEDVIAIVRDDDHEVTVTAWTFGGQQAWQHRIPRPGAEAVTVVGREIGLEVISVWFTTPEHGDADYGELRPVVGDLWWKELNGDHEGVITPVRDGGEALSSEMLIGYHFSQGEEDPDTTSPWFVYLGTDFAEVGLQRSDFTYEVYGSWAGRDWGVTRTETETHLVGGGKRLLLVGDTVGFWGLWDHFVLWTEAGLVQVRDRSFATVVATHQRCAAGGRPAWTKDHLAVGHLLFDFEERDFECLDLPDGTHIQEVLPEGRLIIAPNRDEDDDHDGAERPARQLGRVGAGDWRPIGEGSAFTREGFVLLLDLNDDGVRVLSAYPWEQFNP